MNPEDFWYQRYPERIRRGTVGWPLEARAAYSDIIDWMYLCSTGTIPKDDAAIAEIARCSPKEWAKVKSLVLSKFKAGKDGFRHIFASAQISKHKRKHGTFSMRASKAAHSRWAKTKGNHATSMTQAMLTDARGEKIREEKKDRDIPSTTPVHSQASIPMVVPDRHPRLLEVGPKVLSLCGDSPNLLHFSRVNKWLNEGADPDLDIYPVVETLMKKRNGTAPGSLNYFDRAIADSISSRTKPLPNGNGHATEPQRPAYKTAMEKRSDAVREGVERGRALRRKDTTS